MLQSLWKAIRVFGFVTTVMFAATGPTSAQNQSQSMYTQQWDPYITPAQLDMLISQDAGLQIIDIRSEKYIKKGTIPGAVWMTFKEWRGPSDRPGQPPKEEELAALLGENGIDLAKPVVIHNQSGHTIQSGRAAIVYWLLKTSGAEKIAILDGGFKAWKADGLPHGTDHRVPTPTTVTVDYSFDWWADPVEIFGVASGQSEGAILDARLDGQVKKAIKTGKPMMSMPMASYIPASFFTNHLAAKNMSLESQNAFRSDLEARGIELGKGTLISVCQTGELSALSWFYASEIVGIEKVLYYPDALQGWKSDGGLMFGMKPS